MPTERRTILHISTRLILGGSQENTVLSCEGQALAGHDVHLAFGPIYGPEGSLLERAEAFKTPDGRAITTHVVPHMFRQITPLNDWRCFRELTALIRAIKPDIVHTHSSKAGVLGRWAGVRATGTTRGIVHTIHGPPFHPNQSALKNKLYVAAERFAAKRCRTILGVCDAMTEQFLAERIGRPEQYGTVYSGMETEAFLNPAPGEDRASMRAQLGFTDEDFVVGTVARLAELKGHDDLLDAVGDDLRANPNWKLLWVGDGWWRDRLLGRVREMGLTGQVVTTGLVPQLQVPSMMRAMDVLCHPSYREGLPRTVPQALLCAVPVCASDTDGTKEACIQDETGLLFKPGDASGIREAIRFLHENPEVRQMMGHRGRELCRVRFDWRTMVDELEIVYERALADASTGDGR